MLHWSMWWISRAVRSEKDQPHRADQSDDRLVDDTAEDSVAERVGE